MADVGALMAYRRRQAVLEAHYIDDCSSSSDHIQGQLEAFSPSLSLYLPVSLQTRPAR